MSLNSAFWEKRKLQMGKAVIPSDPVCFNDVMSEQLAISLTEENNEDNDLVLARLLQEQYNEEYNSYLESTSKHEEENDKNGATLNEPFQPIDSFSSDSASADEYEEELNDWDSFDKSDKNISSITIGKQGFAKNGKTFMTKHDADACGTRNAHRTMALDISTGDVGAFEMKLNNQVYNILKAHSVSENKKSAKFHEKREKSGVEHVIDQKTMLILHKLVNRGILDVVDGTVSTGKESHVLHGIGCNHDKKIAATEVAIKVYKTITNEFKNRDQYTKEDPRFKDRFSKQNSRKVIDLWAEKEMQNLVKMRNQGILCPEVLILKKHVLIMEFIGIDGKHAPCLKEAILSDAQWLQAYETSVDIMKKLYNKCKLVHGDLSEYNLLWHNCNVYVIDVGQSVVIDQSNAMHFLKRDCNNICKFFAKKGIAQTISPDQLFLEITGKTVQDCGIYDIS